MTADRHSRELAKTPADLTHPFTKTTALMLLLIERQHRLRQLGPLIFPWYFAGSKASRSLAGSH